MIPLSPLVAKRREDYAAYRISPGDTNRLALIFDPIGEGASFVFLVEIFDEGGKTPPNSHRIAQEMFYVLKGEGVAHCGERSIPLRRGDALLLAPGTSHLVENTGPGRLYCLTLMVPNEDFAELIRSGTREALDEEDWAVLAGGSS